MLDQQIDCVNSNSWQADVQEREFSIPRAHCIHSQKRPWRFIGYHGMYSEPRIYRISDESDTFLWSGWSKFVGNILPYIGFRMYRMEVSVTSDAIYPKFYWIYDIRIDMFLWWYRIYCKFLIWGTMGTERFCLLDPMSHKTQKFALISTIGTRIMHFIRLPLIYVFIIFGVCCII